MDAAFWVYLATNKTHSTLYVGMTNDLARRMWEHRNKVNPKSFSVRYGVRHLVWFESFPTALEAIAAEKKIKGLSHQKKVDMIRSQNPAWRDLCEDWYE
jgi:putative endonuclease